MKKSEFFHKVASTTFATPKLLPTPQNKNPPFFIAGTRKFKNLIVKPDDLSSFLQGLEIDLQSLDTEILL
jgi:hypothetical protein